MHTPGTQTAPPTPTSGSKLEHSGRGAEIGPAVEVRVAPRPQRVTLQGRYAQVVPLNPAEHAEALWEGVRGQDDLWAYLFEGPFASREAFEAKLQLMSQSEDPLFFALCDSKTGKAVGYASYMRVEPAHRVIEVGSILFLPHFQRSIGATEVMYLMARHVFEDLGYRRYEWKCNSLNAPSRRAAIRLGFSFEGIFRQHMIIKGHNRDTAWFSMIDCEWPERKSDFEDWLDVANFDQKGRQRLSLSAVREQRRKT